MNRWHTNKTYTYYTLCTFNFRNCFFRLNSMPSLWEWAYVFQTFRPGRWSVMHSVSKILFSVCPFLHRLSLAGPGSMLVRLPVAKEDISSPRVITAAPPWPRPRPHPPLIMVSRLSGVLAAFGHCWAHNQHASKKKMKCDTPRLVSTIEWPKWFVISHKLSRWSKKYCKFVV